MRNLRNEFNKRDERRMAIENKELRTFAEECIATGMEAVAFKLNNTETTLTVDEVKNYFGQKDGVINLEEISNQLRFNAVVAYVCGSDVGVNTKGIELGKTITCADDLLKIFKPCTKKNNGSGFRYVTEDGQSPIFQEGVNITTVTTDMGITNDLFKVSYHEQARFMDILSKLDLSALTEEDIKMIIRDLDVIGRAMQEIAIDSAKDKSKAKNWKSINELVNMSVKMLVNAGISDNFSEIKSAKRSKEMGNVLGDVQDYAMKFDAVLPKDAYTTEEFAALSAEEQMQAENSELVCGLLGHARKAILDGSNEEISKLVKNYYNNANADSYGVYASKFAHVNRQLTVFLNKVYEVMSLSDMVELRMSDESVEELRCAVYNEVANNKLLKTPLGKGAMIKHALAAGMLKLKEEKDGTVKESYDASSLKFSVVTRLFKDEFICEYGNEPTSVKMTNHLQVALNVSKRSTAELINGAVYKMVSGVATMYSVSKDAIEKVDGVLETREAYTGLAMCKDNALYGLYDVNKVSDNNVGVCIVKDWFDLNTGKELDLSNTADADALKQHINLLLEADEVHVTGKDKNLIAAIVGGKFYPICRLYFTPGLVEFPADNSVKSKKIDVKDVFAYINPADEDKNYSAYIRGMFTYAAK